MSRINRLHAEHGSEGSASPFKVDSQLDQWNTDENKKEEKLKNKKSKASTAVTAKPAQRVKAITLKPKLAHPDLVNRLSSPQQLKSKRHLRIQKGESINLDLEETQGSRELPEMNFISTVNPRSKLIN